jgi:hypothetical protein
MSACREDGDEDKSQCRSLHELGRASPKWRNKSKINGDPIHLLYVRNDGALTSKFQFDLWIPNQDDDDQSNNKTKKTIRAITRQRRRSEQQQNKGLNASGMQATANRIPKS